MLAIIVPYYKLSFFEETLQSLAEQKDKRFKVYIGDDYSPEDCTVLLENYQDKFDFVYYRFKENVGRTSLVKQWNRCIDMIGDEEWIMILGDDDILGENAVVEFYNNLCKLDNSTDVVRFSTQKIDENGLPISKIYKHPKNEKSIDFLFRKSRSSLSEYIFRKKQVLKIGFKDFPLAWYSDVLAVLEFSNFNEVFSINESIVKIRITSLSISGNQNNLKLKSKAKFSFYYYLLTQKTNKFTKKQKLILFGFINKLYINDKKNLFFFRKITKLYFSNYMYRYYFIFISLVLSSFVISVLKINK